MNKAIGHKNIPVFFVKIVAITIAPYLLCSLDFSFSHGILPEYDTLPISFLTCFSKILKRLIYNKFLKFQKPKHNTIYKAQHNFRKLLSTIHVIIDIVTTSLDDVNLNLFTGLVFLDIQKTFLTVFHNILLTKQEHYVIRGSSNLLIKSFLNRKQYTFIND